MTLPPRIICIGLGGKSPVQSDILGELRRLRYQYGDLHDSLKDLEEVNSTVQVGSTASFPNLDQVLQHFHSKDSPRGVTFVAINFFAKLITILNFPEKT